MAFCAIARFLRALDMDIARQRLDAVLTLVNRFGDSAFDAAARVVYVRFVRR